MDESNSSQPAKCPCGFWGSSKTLGLCSRCYKEDIEKSSVDLDANTSRDSSQQTVTKPELLRATTSGLRVVPNSSTNRNTSATTDSRLFRSTKDRLDPTTTSSVASSPTNNLYKLPACVYPQMRHAAQPSLVHADTNNSGERNSTSNSTDNHAKSTKTDDIKTEDNINGHGTQAETQNEDSHTVDQRGVKRSHSTDEHSDSSSSSKDHPPQKNKKRCHKCSCKLNIAQRAIGRCKCDYIFCSIHRMPERHNCEFDHKEDGRRDAKKKMVKPRRHVGTNLKRIDSEPT